MSKRASLVNKAGGYARPEWNWYQVRDKLDLWFQSIQKNGMALTRISSGFHDEPLKSKREGQRSIRLNRQWRVIYWQDEQGHLTIIHIEGITPHDY